jgi:hypothetical protein
MKGCGELVLFLGRRIRRIFMKSIDVRIEKEDVWEEVAKNTAYMGAKAVAAAETDVPYDRWLIQDDDLQALDRFWDEAKVSCVEFLKELVVNGGEGRGTSEEVSVESEEDSSADGLVPSIGGEAIGTAPAGLISFELELEVGSAFDERLTRSVQSALRSFFVAWITGEWLRFVSAEGATDYFTQASDWLVEAERLLYSRCRPTAPTD